MNPLLASLPSSPGFLDVLKSLGLVLLVAHVMLALGAIIVWAERRVSALI